MDNPSGPVYLAWSGWVGDLPLFGALWVLYHRHNCHARRCPRIAKHSVDGTPYCTRHHPKGDRL
jgi:hypothetical protein